MVKWGTFSILGLLTVLLVIALTATLDRQIARPTRALAAATAAAALGRLHVRAPVAGPAEIADVAERFNALLAARVEMEMALRRSEARFAKAFHGSPIAICIAILDAGRIIDTNERFIELVGYRRDELIGIRHFSLKPRRRQPAATFGAAR